MSIKVCYNFKETGSCRFLDKCRFSHDADNGITADDDSNDSGFEIVNNRKNRSKQSGNQYNEYNRNINVVNQQSRQSRGAQNDQTTGTSQSTSSRSIDKQCHQWIDTGRCSFGDKCRFSHLGADSSNNDTAVDTSNTSTRSSDRPTGNSNECYEFAESGECKFGDRCRFSHNDNPRQRRAEYQQKQPCHQYQQNGSCSYGDNCRFSHDSTA